MYLDKYLKLKFSGLELKEPLFYNYNSSLRFDLGNEINEMKKRSHEIFNSLFEFDDLVYLVNFSDFFKENPTDINESKTELIQFFHELINDNKEIKKKNVLYRYERDEDDEPIGTFRYSTYCKVSNVKFNNILFGIINRSLNYKGYNFSPTVFGDIYIINAQDDVIFHLYDYRGVDVLSPNKNILQKLFNKYNDWLLEYDRSRMEKLFSEG